MSEEQVVETPSLDANALANMSLDELYKLESTPSQATENQSEKSEQLETEKQEAQDKVEEKNPNDALKEQPTDLETLKQQIVKLQGDLEIDKQRIAEKDQFIDRQAKELGQYRNTKKLSKEELNEKFLTDPATAIEAYQANKQLEEQEVVASRQQQIRETRELVLQKISNFNDLVNDMAELAKADGIPESLISNFKQNPFAIGESPGVLINLAERAKASREIKDLKAQIANLKDSKKNVVKNIEKAVNQTKTITANAGSSNTVEDNLDNFTPEILANMSLKDLYAMQSKFMH